MNNDMVQRQFVVFLPQNAEQDHRLSHSFPNQPQSSPTYFVIEKLFEYGMFLLRAHLAKPKRGNVLGHFGLKLRPERGYFRTGPEVCYYRTTMSINTF